MGSRLTFPFEFVQSNFRILVSDILFGLDIIKALSHLNKLKIHFRFGLKAIDVNDSKG